MKVFGLGFQKTGTTTLDEALKILGYKVTGPDLDLAEDLLKKDYTRLYQRADQFNAFQDNPWALFYEEFDKRYPGSKFILTLRDEESWIKSVLNHFGKDKTKMRKWIYGEASPYGNEDIYIERFRKHYSDVRTYFRDRPDDLLEVNWQNGDSWKELCDFLDVDIPDQDFPHGKKGNYKKTPMRILKDSMKEIFRKTGLR